MFQYSICNVFRKVNYKPTADTKLLAHSTTSKDDIYNASTEEDEPPSDEQCKIADDAAEQVPSLPNIFTNKHFYIYSGNMNSTERRTLVRYIIAFNGLD